MIYYNSRKLKQNDLNELAFIAQMHESLPASWIKKYFVNIEETDKTLTRLIEKHKGNDIFCFVAEKDTQIISYIWAEISEKDNEVLDIFSLWTCEKYRGEGIASHLKIELEKWAKSETNAKKIITTVSAYNENMIALNKKLGYEIMYHKMSKKI